MNLRPIPGANFRAARAHSCRKNPYLALILLVACIAVTSCATPIASRLAGTRTSSVPRGSDYILLGPRAVVPATLTSNVSGTAFGISGVHPTADLILPATNVARVMLPLSEITITARSKCYPDIVHHVQIGNGDHDLPIDFVFSNAERRPNCEDEVERYSVGSGASPPSLGEPSKLAWVIANSDYMNGWPALDFVENDKSNMIALLHRTGFRVVTSFNLARQQLLADENNFRQLLQNHPWSLIVVYLSGHGIGLQGQNYFVPADAPDASTVAASSLYAIATIQQILRPSVSAGGLAIVLVDACRSGVGTTTHPMVAPDNQDVLVNYSTSPGSTSYDSPEGMSAWTERFVTISDAYPWLGIDQLVMYADRYTKWQSAASCGFRHRFSMAASPPESHDSAGSKTTTSDPKSRLYSRPRSDSTSAARPVAVNAARMLFPNGRYCRHDPVRPCSE